MMNLRTVAKRYPRNASGQRQVLDLYEDFQLADALIWSLTLILRGTMTSTGAGAITGFHRDAPAGMIQNLKFGGQYDPWGARREVFNGPLQQFLWPGNDTSKITHALLRTSAGATSTDPFRATVAMPLRDPYFARRERVYIDVRDYSSLLLEIANWETDANLAPTNLSSVQAVELEVQFQLIENGPGQGAPHFEPSLSYKELPLSTTSTKLTDSGQIAWDGFATAIWLQQFDESQTGDNERSNGLLKQVSIRQANKNLVDDQTWDSILRDTWTRYTPALTTAETIGIAGIPLDPPWDGRNGPANVLRDTSTTPPPGVTAVTPTTSDALMTLIVAADPMFGAETLI